MSLVTIYYIIILLIIGVDSVGRSQLLKDVVSGKETIENVLLRLKIILSDLGNDSIMDWVNGEFQGYKKEEDVPSYRVIKGLAMGDFLVNFKTMYRQAQVPLQNLINKEAIDEITTLHLKDGISTIQNVLSGEDRNNYGIVIPTAYCHTISVGKLQIISMRVTAPHNMLAGIVSCVKSKLVEVIMELEKQFDNLDDLDIKSQVDEDPSKKEEVLYNLQQIIYDHSINVGDKNKIENSKLGNMFGETKS